jgi:hypothetical protein
MSAVRLQERERGALYATKWKEPDLAYEWFKTVRVAAYSGEERRPKIDWLIVLMLHILGVTIYVSV